MNVSTDPRIIKQMLLTQWTNAANPLETEASADRGGMFATMLNGHLSGDPQSAGDAADAWPANLRVGVGDIAWVGLTGADSRAWPADGDLRSRSQDYDDLIAAAAARYGIDSALIKAIVQTESGFNPDAMSRVGAKGLMQLMDDTARGLGVSDSFDPAQNIDGGTRFLSYLLRKYDGQVMPALAAYNAGPGRVDRLGLTTDEQVGLRVAELPEETQLYIRKVLTALQRWSRQP